jgi:hypothetical protein
MPRNLDRDALLEQFVEHDQALQEVAAEPVGFLDEVRVRLRLPSCGVLRGRRARRLWQEGGLRITSRTPATTAAGPQVLHDRRCLRGLAESLNTGSGLVLYVAAWMLAPGTDAL